MAKNPRLIDMSGRTIGLWTVGPQAGNAPRGGALWLCRCACGMERPVSGADLRSGKSTNCGCTNVGRLGDFRRSHGETNSRLHHVWKNMKRRCRDADDPDYGGRGIAVCPDWQDFIPFRDWAMGSGYSESLTLERVDVNGGYGPANCTWADAKTQARNRRFVKRAPDGTPWPEVAEAHGVSTSMLNQRRNSGWPPELAATLPPGSRFKPPRERNEKGQGA